ncbi:FlgO family outer membrane protein [Methylotuvimicrobium sp. KM2]|jgi:hypothetical protein|uniref:FlgO family outer membrane protein n=1 Tax=unclassified Methylotuvimicrobium TaxID=2822412 RepID=UPI001D7C9F51|nr:hypothetical protein [Gammaproteobacteria bacterium]
MFKKQAIVLLISAVTALSGCNRVYYAQDVDDDDLVEVSYDAVDELLTHLRHPLPRGSLVVVNSLVNVDDMSQSFSFGRIVSDQIASAFHRSGYRVMGMELPTEIFVKNDTGILQLSDETKAGLAEVGAQALLVGTFAPGKKNAYVSLRVVDIDSGYFVATTDYSIAMGPDAKNLLKAKPVEEEPKEEEEPMPMVDESMDDFDLFE